jgi:hypothetical protein
MLAGAAKLNRTDCTQMKKKINEKKSKENILTFNSTSIPSSIKIEAHIRNQVDSFTWIKGKEGMPTLSTGSQCFALLIQLNI